MHDPKVNPKLHFPKLPNNNSLIKRIIMTYMNINDFSLFLSLHILFRCFLDDFKRN